MFHIYIFIRRSMKHLQLLLVLSLTIYLQQESIEDTHYWGFSTNLFPMRDISKLLDVWWRGNGKTFSQWSQHAYHLTSWLPLYAVSINMIAQFLFWSCAFVRFSPFIVYIFLCCIYSTEYKRFFFRFFLSYLFYFQMFYILCRDETVNDSDIFCTLFFTFSMIKEEKKECIL